MSVVVDNVRVFALAAAGDAAGGTFRISADGLATARVGPLARAQQRWWLRHEECPAGGRGLLTVLDTWDAAGASITSVRAVVERLLRRHEALRTTYGIAADGSPVQYVRDAPALVLAALPAVARASVERSVGLIRSELGRREFMLDKELPVQIALIVDGDSVRAVVVGFHHIVVDHHALTVLRAEFRALLSGRALPGRELRHPIDWAQLEDSAAGRRQAVRALAGLARTYAQIPYRTVFPAPPETGGPAFRVLRSSSQRAAADLREAASRYAVTEPSVLVAAYLSSLALVCGNRRVAARVVYSNRHLENAQRSVACLAQDVVVWQDIEPHVRCTTVLRAVARRCLTQYARGHFPYDRARETVAGVENDRGARLAVRNSINYLPPAPRAVAAGAAAKDTVDWIEVADVPGYVHDLELTVIDSLRSLTFHLNANLTAVAPASVEALVAGMTHLLAGLAAGTDPLLREIGESAGIATPSWAEPWREVDSCLVDLHEVRSLVRMHPDVVDCDVFVDGGRLVAGVQALPRLTAEDLRRFLLARLTHDSAAIVPHAFVLQSRR